MLTDMLGMLLSSVITKEGFQMHEVSSVALFPSEQVHFSILQHPAQKNHLLLEAFSGNFPSSEFSGDLTLFPSHVIPEMIWVALSYMCIFLF